MCLMYQCVFLSYSCNFSKRWTVMASFANMYQKYLTEFIVQLEEEKIGELRELFQYLAH